MEKKNMVLLTVIAVATLLVAVVGATFAYFSITTTNNFGGGTADQGKTNITASDAAKADAITITESSNAGSFTETGVYPGHKEVAAIKVNAKSAQGTVPNVKITYNTTKNDNGTVTPNTTTKTDTTASSSGKTLPKTGISSTVLGLIAVAGASAGVSYRKYRKIK